MNNININKNIQNKNNDKNKLNINNNKKLNNNNIKQNINKNLTLNTLPYHKLLYHLISINNGSIILHNLNQLIII